MPQSPFMMILALSKNPRDSEVVVFQAVMKSVFVLIGMCAQTKERVKHFGAEQRMRLPELCFSREATGAVVFNRAHKIDCRIRT